MRLVLALIILAAHMPAQTVIAHRGGRAQRSENSMAAFRTAIAQGVPVLELDVVLSQDGFLVVHHDLAVNAEICSGASKRFLSTLRLAEIWAIDCGTLRHPAYPKQIPAPGARMPVLEEVLELVAGTKTKLMVETKMAKDGEAHFVAPARVVGVLDTAIRRYGLEEQVWLQSFDHRTLAEMRRRNPRVRLVMLNPHTRIADYVAPARALGAEVQFLNFRIIEARDVEALHAAGIEVFSGTTDDPAQWKKLAALGVDAILTDDPAGLSQWFRDNRGRKNE